MFKKGEYVVCGNNGICKVTDVTTLNMTNTPKDRLYYILKPVYAESSTVYIPVDNHKVSIRPALTEKETHELIAKIPSLELAIALGIEKQGVQEYITKEIEKLTVE